MAERSREDNFNQLTRNMRSSSQRAASRVAVTPKQERYVDVSEPPPSSSGRTSEGYKKIATNLQQAGWRRATAEEMSQAGVSAGAIDGEWWRSGNMLVMMTEDGAQGARMLGGDRAPAQQQPRADQRPAARSAGPAAASPQARPTPAAPAAAAPAQGPIRGMAGRAAGGPTLDSRPQAPARSFKGAMPGSEGPASVLPPAPPATMSALQDGGAEMAKMQAGAAPASAPTASPAGPAAASPRLQKFADQMVAEGMFSGQVRPGETLAQALQREGVQVPVGLM